MSFSVRIATDLVSVEAGATVPLGIEIANRSDDTERFEMEVEGLDPDWTALPVPTFSADPRDIQTEKLFFKPPRVSESLAGTFPFVVKVRSLVTGEQRTAQGVLEIKPYHHLTMELAPKKGIYSPAKKANAFEATVMNLGNTEHTLQLFASDPEDALAYEFSQNQISVGPGQTKSVTLSAKPTESRPFASSRLHGFSVTARSVETPSVASSAQAQLEERPMVSPSGIILFVLAVGLAVLWWALFPKPPHVDSLSAIPLEPTAGQEVKIEWSSSNASSVRLMIGSLVVPGLRREGSYTFIAKETTEIQAVAISEAKESDPVSINVRVKNAPAVPNPVIVRFDVTPKQVKFGETLLIKYKLGGSIDRAVLEPLNMPVDRDLEQMQVKADLPAGKVDFRLVATNSAGKTVSKSVTVDVVAGSEASIVLFRIEPTKLSPEGGTVTVTWQLAKAERVELQVGNQTILLDSPSGNRDFTVTESTDFTLIGYDSQGRKVVRKERVEAPPPGTEPPPTTTGGGG